MDTDVIYAKSSMRRHVSVCVFKSTPFSKVSVCARPHDNAAFSKVSVFESLHFQTRFRKSPFSLKTLNKRLRVDGRRKRTEKSPFSHENVYVWTWPKSPGFIFMYFPIG